MLKYSLQSLLGKGLEVMLEVKLACKQIICVQINVYDRGKVEKPGLNQKKAGRQGLQMLNLAQIPLAKVQIHQAHCTSLHRRLVLVGSEEHLLQ